MGRDGEPNPQGGPPIPFACGEKAATRRDSHQLSRARAPVSPGGLAFIQPSLYYKPRTTSGWQPQGRRPWGWFAANKTGEMLSPYHAFLSGANSTVSGSNPTLLSRAYSTKPITKAITGAGEMKPNFSALIIGRIATTNPTAQAM